MLNEADTRAKLIDPQLRAVGWGESQIEREHYFLRGRAFTAGRIYLVGEESRRREPRRADYLLRLHNALAIAVIKAKDESHPVDAGLEQAKVYALTLGVPFAYSSNGHRFVEFDFFHNRSRMLAVFPSPEDLLRRWEAYQEHTRPSHLKLAAADPTRAFGNNPLLQPACPLSICGKDLRYFQELAINRVLERVTRGQRRILLTMATGTGKTFTAFQIVWKLKKSGWLRKPVLFLADRIVLRDQAYNAFAPFADGQSDPRGIIQGGRLNLNRDLYFALYQALDSDDGAEPLYRRIPRDFFGLVIIDECHRSGFGKWNEVLQHFPDAIQLGMTATPKQSESIDTYAYFCGEEPKVPLDLNDPTKGTWHPPAYQYSLGQGIEDGFLATYKVHRVRTTVDRDGLHVQDAQTQGAEIYITVSRVYEGLLQRLGNENKMAGEFYTPRPVIRFIVQVVNPVLGETVYDPACGSAGFLAEAYEHMRKAEKSCKDYETLQRKTLIGQEKKSVPALLGLMNLVLHGVMTPDIRRRNTLEENIRNVSERFDMVLTNPPFGGTENAQIQQNFPVKSNATELLFIEHIMKKLKPRDGARCGMVVPEGTLFRGGAFATVKADLLRDLNLYMVVSLPPGTFAPYSDVKTGLLFFERPGPTKETLYYELPIPEGLKKFSKGSPIADEHFAEARQIWQCWDAYRCGKGPQPEPTANSWIEAAETLAVRGYDLSAKNPNRPESEKLPHPAELTATLLERNRELHAILENLHAMLSNGNEEASEAS